ncbi:MAG TPA: DUF484 domain-containing protein [Sphingomicrobium sp.]|nr:DUF484 domain-containing protein [Sphingomicrobium sp.]
MGQVIHFEKRAVASLQERLGAAVVANEELIAFARGHSGAVASINTAALEAIESPCIESLLDVVTRRWPDVLGIDVAAIALRVGKLGFRADSSGIERVEAAFVDRMLAGLQSVQVRSVASGHPLFGASSMGSVRAEALIRIDGPPPLPCGLIALGQRTEIAVENSHGSELLVFLGRVVAATIRRCVATA